MKVKQNIIAFILGMLVMMPVGAYGGSLIVKAVNTPVLVDGVQLKTSVYSINGSTSAPVKAVAEAMGGTVKASGGKVYVETPKTDLEKVVKDCKDSCVMIYAYQPNEKVNQGSGWVYNGYVITAQHVIQDAEKIDIFTDDSIYSIRGTKVDIKTDLDVAVLKIGVKLPSVKLGDSYKLVEGEKLVAIASPKGSKNAIDECIYTGISYNRGKYDIGISESNLPAGSSGGAFFNYRSEIVGMNILGDTGVNDAIPINDLIPILNELK